MARKVYVGAENFEKATLPSGYTQVEYIQSSGTQYIDTKFVPNQDTRVVAEVELKLNGSNYFLFGARNNSTQDSTAAETFGFNAYQTTYRTHYYNGWSDFGASISYDKKFTIDVNKNVTILNGEHVITRAYTEFTAPCNMTIFAVNTAGTVGTYGTAKVYSFKIYNNGTMVRNFIPCTNASGTAGLYDLVNGTFYANAGSGTFTVGATYKNGVARNVKQIYVGVASKARRVKKGYIGIGGVARPFWGDYELVYYGTLTALSQARYRLAATTVGNYALFAGGQGSNNTTFYTTVDAYNESLVRSKPTALTVARANMAATTVGGYAIFAGGNRYESGSKYSSVIDVYNASLTRQKLELAQNRSHIGATTVGGYAIFAGGWNGSEIKVHVTVEVFNESLTKSTATGLSQGRYSMGATTVGNYALFAGGSTNGTYVNTVNAYNASLTRSTPTALSHARSAPAATTVGGYALFMGGSGETTPYRSNVTDAYNESLTRVIPEVLATGREDATATTLGKFAIVAGGTGDGAKLASAETYDESLTRQTETSMSAVRDEFAATTIGKYAIFAGGINTSPLATVDAYTLI